MSGVFGGKTNSTSPVAITNLNIQTSAYGQVVPVVYGANRIAGNLLWYSGFRSVAVYTNQGSGKGGGGCFAAGTMISTPLGDRKIETIKTGDVVYTRNDITKEIERGTVTAHYDHDVSETNDTMLYIHLSDRVLYVTTYHWIHVESTSGNDYIEAQHLKTGMLVTNRDGSHSSILLIEKAPDVTNVYNLDVSPNYNYFANDVLVHNGGGGGKSSITGYNYFADVIFGLCEGPISYVGYIWLNKTQEYPSDVGMSIINGYIPQDVWSPMSAKYPDQAIPYSGIAYAAAFDLALGQSPELPSMNYEVFGFFNGTSANGYDADPSLVITDILTNSVYGGGFPASALGTAVVGYEGYVLDGSVIRVAFYSLYFDNLDVAYNGVAMVCVASNPQAGQYSFDQNGNYTFNAADNGKFVAICYVWKDILRSYQGFTGCSGLGISPAYTTQSSMSSLLNDIAKFTHSEFVWSSGMLTIIPRGNSALSI